MFEKIADSLFLRKQKKMLQKELNRFEEQYTLTRKFPEYGTSEEENVQEMEKFQENLGLQKNIKNLIKDTKKAIQKIDKGTYSVCEICNGAIEQGRLKAYPAAGICVTCANKKFRKR
ncbi:MAG: Transcriptional regulator, TraR/DksA family [Berkelbacteria bacterium GW2011_GWA1_39_10]|uniref:Transcriptional regulator, TraR/DksA family n=1 Tax=Berkelbacteria bacterium GW2011_GWA1_39_10 TaxID=1618332 RepID=A0A0G0NX59_9BACT|nr:MAG: Transcriptional regulator, TraR/DksA family [Berkelbacteria bacterium GW2011_GWA1_39_10]